MKSDMLIFFHFYVCNFFLVESSLSKSQDQLEQVSRFWLLFSISSLLPVSVEIQTRVLSFADQLGYEKGLIVWD